jgi:hypothetical protein
MVSIRSPAAIGNGGLDARLTMTNGRACPSAQVKMAARWLSATPAVLSMRFAHRLAFACVI